MSGRVISEALRTGPPASSVRVERVQETVKTPDGSYELTAHISVAAGHRYLDYTEVRRRNRACAFGHPQITQISQIRCHARASRGPGRRSETTRDRRGGWRALSTARAQNLRNF